MRKVLSLFLLVLAVVAGYKLAVWYGTYRALTGFQDRLQSVGVLAWDGSDSTLAGQVRLVQPRIQFFDLSAPLRADSLTLSRPNPWALLKTLYGGGTQPPDQWVMRLENFNMSLPDQLFKPWAGADFPALGAFNPWRLYRCGDHRTLNGKELRGMGVPRVSGDAVLNYRLAPSDGNIHLALDINAGVVGSLDLQATTPPPGSWNVGDWPQALATPTSVHLVVRDGGFMRRVSAYCSEATGLTPGQWALQAARAWQAALEAQGLMPSSQTVALYKQWLQKGGELTVDLQPSGSFRFARLASGPIPDAIKLAGLKILYNGDEVPGLEMTRQGGIAPAAASPTPAAAPKAAGASQASRGPAFRSLDATQAPRWVGRQVRVLYDGGKTLQGRLDAADSSSLTVTRMVEGGQVSYPVKLSEVHRLQVWRSAGETPPLPQRTSAPVGTPAMTSTPYQSTAGEITSSAKGAAGDGN